MLQSKMVLEVNFQLVLSIDASENPYKSSLEPGRPAVTWIVTLVKELHLP